MKARLLKAILDTQYAVSNHEDYIAVGSPLCHDLYTVHKHTLKIKYALDTFNKGRGAINNEKGERVWDRLHELVENGQIQDIINGHDEIENPLPVFTIRDGKLIESVTDKYGWPNTDHEGWCMYNNTHFPTKEQALNYGIEENEAGINSLTRSLKEAKDRVAQIESWISKNEEDIKHFKSLLLKEISA